MPQLLMFLAIGTYFWVGWKFWTGFRRTNFESNRLILTVLWPVLVFANPGYRSNFQKALKG
jgi:hypothetical protein